MRNLRTVVVENSHGSWQYANSVPPLIGCTFNVAPGHPQQCGSRTSARFVAAHRRQ